MNPAKSFNPDHETVGVANNCAASKAILPPDEAPHITSLSNRKFSFATSHFTAVTASVR